MKKKINNHSRLVSNVFVICGRIIFMSVAILTAVACADDDLSKTDHQTNDTAIRFNVTDAQEDVLSRATTSTTRGLTTVPISTSDLAPKKLSVTGSGAENLCLIQSTIEGVNPVKVDNQTRATIITKNNLGIFSSSGYRGASEAGISLTPNWFYNEDTNPNGTLVKRYDWDWPINTYARFYAIHPKATAANGVILSSETTSGVPSLDFTVNNDVTQQKDLMTACSNDTHYIHGEDPSTSLKFRHALAAIKFSVGSNLSPKKIIKVEIRNAIVKGKYKLADNYEGTRPTNDNGWTLNDIPAHRSNVELNLGYPGIDPYNNPNTYLMGNANDNYTFYMIPQVLTGKGVQAVITFADGTSITSTLKGEWKAGTTSEYKLSQKNSTWQYNLTITQSLNFEYNDSYSQSYYISSYRQAYDSYYIQQPVAWKVVKYEESSDGGTTWTDLGLTKPDWLTTFTKTEGTGGTSYDYGYALPRIDDGDQLAAYNKVLQDADPKGKSDSYWNLANPIDGGNYIVESANCYLISAPGYYRIPLVYGNAIKNGNPNTDAYVSNAAAVMYPYGYVHNDWVLHRFLDHNDSPINSPYINIQNASKPATQASIVWASDGESYNTQTDILKFSAQPIKYYNGVAFVEFEIVKEKIRNGNIVIAVKNADGTIMWSWHLWFDHSDVLKTTSYKDHQGKIYDFPKRPLGFMYTVWSGTSYTQDRQVRITIEQNVGNMQKQKAQMIISQRPNYYGQRKIRGTYYQFGRKDAFPPQRAAYKYHYDIWGNDDRPTIGETIKSPFTFYSDGSHDQYLHQPYMNLWSTHYNTDHDRDAKVTKTIYDPSPAGFKVPGGRAFTGFAKAGHPSQWLDGSQFLGDNDDTYNGWLITQPSGASIFIPALGWKEYNYSYPSSYIRINADYGYWQALVDFEAGMALIGRRYDFFSEGRAPHHFGYSVFPVADK